MIGYRYSAATLINQALVDREGTFILLSASHFTRVSTSPLQSVIQFCLSMIVKPVLSVVYNEQ